MLYPNVDNNRLSLSNILIIVSAFVTLLSFIEPEILRFGMNSFAFFTQDWWMLAIQLILFQFLHGGILHLLGNSLFLYLFGNTVERMLGEGRYILLFVLETLASAAAIIVFSQATTIGISGFTMAILAYLALELRAQRHPEANTAFLVLGINILIGLSPGISLIGHAAGAVVGAGYYGLRHLRLSR